MENIEESGEGTRWTRQRFHIIAIRPGAKSMSTILLVILILLIIGAVPSWPYSRGWGYGPSGLLGVLLIVLIVLLLTGRV